MPLLRFIRQDEATAAKKKIVHSSRNRLSRTDPLTEDEDVFENFPDAHLGSDSSRPSSTVGRDRDRAMSSRNATPSPTPLYHAEMVLNQPLDTESPPVEGREGAGSILARSRQEVLKYMSVFADNDLDPSKKQISELLLLIKRAPTKVRIHIYCPETIFMSFSEGKLIILMYNLSSSFSNSSFSLSVRRL